MIKVFINVLINILCFYLKILIQLRFFYNSELSNLS